MSVNRSVSDLLDVILLDFDGFKVDGRKAMRWSQVLGGFSRAELFEAYERALLGMREKRFAPSVHEIADQARGRTVKTPVHHTDLNGSRMMRSGGGYVVDFWLEHRLDPGEPAPEFLTDMQAKRLERDQDGVNRLDGTLGIGEGD